MKAKKKTSQSDNAFDDNTEIDELRGRVVNEAPESGSQPHRYIVLVIQFVILNGHA